MWAEAGGASTAFVFVLFFFDKLRHLWVMQLSMVSRRVMAIFFCDFYPRGDFSPITALKH